MILVQAAYTVLANSTLIGGLAASLGRVKHGEAVTAGTFVRDVVRYFRPAAGVYIALVGAPYAVYLIDVVVSYAGGGTGQGWSPLGIVWGPGWRLVMLFLMLAPYSAVFWGSGWWAGVRRAARDWLGNAWAALSFIALGLSLAAAPLAVLGLLREYVIPSTWVNVLYALLNSGVRVALALILAIAVWEFYWRITKSSAAPRLGSSTSG